MGGDVLGFASGRAHFHLGPRYAPVVARYRICQHLAIIAYLSQLLNKPMKDITDGDAFESAILAFPFHNSGVSNVLRCGDPRYHGWFLHEDLVVDFKALQKDGSSNDELIATVARIYECYGEMRDVFRGAFVKQLLSTDSVVRTEAPLKWLVFNSARVIDTLMPKIAGISIDVHSLFQGMRKEREKVKLTDEACKEFVIIRYGMNPIEQSIKDGLELEKVICSLAESKAFHPSVTVFPRIYERVKELFSLFEEKFSGFMEKLLQSQAMTSRFAGATTDYVSIYTGDVVVPDDLFAIVTADIIAARIKWRDFLRTLSGKFDPKQFEERWNAAQETHEKPHAASNSGDGVMTRAISAAASWAAAYRSSPPPDPDEKVLENAASAAATAGASASASAMSSLFAPVAAVTAGASASAASFFPRKRRRKSSKTFTLEFCSPCPCGRQGDVSAIINESFSVEVESATIEGCYITVVCIDEAQYNSMCVRYDKVVGSDEFKRRLKGELGSERSFSYA